MNNQYISNLKAISIQNKYFRWYVDIITNAMNRKTLPDYYEKHHILPKSFEMGGEKDINNIVKLTAREHFLVHCFLVKFSKGKFKIKMEYALNRMVNKNLHQSGRYFNSRLFESLKMKKRPKFIRLWKLDKVKYLYECEIDECNKMIQEGWSLKMTEEYKCGRVGMMLGKKHSKETKEKMSKNAGKPMLGKKMSEATKKKISTTLKGREFTDVHKERSRTGLINHYQANPDKFSGSNNPMYGKKRIALFDPKTGEQRMPEINDPIVLELIDMGWERGLFKNRKIKELRNVPHMQ